MNKETNANAVRPGSLCLSELERHGAPHLCRLLAGHDGSHLCNSCGVTW